MNNETGDVKKHNINKNKAKVRRDERINEVISQMKDINKGKIKSDVLGSYTGVTEDNDYPVQDADDL